MQINAPQSVFGLDQSKVRQAPPSAEFDTPEKINELLYNYTPGSNSAMQRSREYGDALTPELMQRENQIQASMDSAAATDARARAVAMATEIRRKEAAIQQAREEARAISASEMAQRAEARAIAQEARAVATAAQPPAIGTVVAGDLGEAEKRKIAAREGEINSKPKARKVLEEIRKRFGNVTPEEARLMKAYVKTLTLTKDSENFILGELRE